LGEGWLVTPTNSCLGRLDASRLSRLNADGRHVDGDPPSKEAFLHLAVYRNRPRDGAIVHLHSTYTVAVSCLDGLNAEDCIPPLTPYFVMKIGRLPLVPYHRPGALDLAESVGKMAARHRALLLSNHGSVVAGSSLADAVNAAEELEETAKLFLLLEGAPKRTLHPQQIEELRSIFKLE
jgi:ribulose-5-phosphate 4-epimerase/fuculose-1-phosphate aldolase